VTVAERPSPELRILRGDPSRAELAALTAVITGSLAAATAAERATDSPTAAVHGRWNDPAHTLRRPWPVGPGGWRAAGG
jgi:Acyl-CoA carboxylase epsilon subunit